jgi:hypothetical protein
MQVLSYNEAAARAGIVRRTLERLISLGVGPPVIVLSARRRGILEADLETWLLQRRRAVPGEVAEKSGSLGGLAGRKPDRPSLKSPSF